MRERLAAAADLLLCVVVVAVACAIYLSGVGGSFALNSDMVMPYVVYTDAVAGPNALSGWLLPESPYWSSRITRGTISRGSMVTGW